MSTFYQRYLDGKHEEVWDQLCRLGELVNDDRYIDDATAVAAETMKRARQNVETIITRLEGLGYRFFLKNGGEQTTYVHSTQMYGAVELTSEMVLTPPSDSVDHDMIRIEEAFGILPLSLAAWYQHVGSVDLTGRHRRICEHDLASMTIDGQKQRVWVRPLIVFPLLYALVEYGDRMADRPEPPVLFPLAPNYDCEFDGIRIPDSRADAVCTMTGQLFVEYLRHCFKWGGFPGWSQYPQRPQAELTYLASDLLPL